MLIATILSALGVLAVWFLFGFRIIRENESAVVVLLGNPRRVVKSGLRHTWWPIEWIKSFTTNLIELNFRLAGIITKEGDFQNKRYSEANVGVETTMYFRWPENGDLIKTLRIVRDPEDIEALKNLFEETVLDAFRTVGGNKTWREIVQDRKAFADEVLQNLTDEATDPLNQAGLQNVRVVITHLNLPDNLKNAITEPEVARIKKEAFITQKEAEKKGLQLEGEGNKSKLENEGEGVAYARKKLFEAIGEQPADLQKEILYTLREMAKGTSNTILFPIPSKLTDVLEDIFGSKKGNGGHVDFKKLISGLSESQKNLLFKLLGECIRKGDEI